MKMILYIKPNKIKLKERLMTTVKYSRFLDKKRNLEATNPYTDLKSICKMYDMHDIDRV
jgi:hypothetical protein